MNGARALALEPGPRWIQYGHRAAGWVRDTPRRMSAMETSAAAAACFGECRDCDRRHELPFGNARAHALDLMREFEALRRLDYLAPDEAADPLLSFEHLFQGGDGKMFGVLECEDANGATVVLRAFSSLRQGIRDVPGWVSPVLSAETYYGMIVPEQERIQALTAQMADVDRGSSSYGEFARERKNVSHALFAEMRKRYRFRNFRGEERALAEAVWPAAPSPGGVGECCAPKLLNHAARNGLRPLGIAEFYWGESNSKISGEFYPSCEVRCQPILGFMLCGLDR